MRVAGVDGTRGGWVAILLDEGRFAGDVLLRPVETTFEELGTAEVIGVDVPIGFGPRKADAHARAFLTGAASSVFTTPTRNVLEVPFRPGLGVTAQAHALAPRILHVTRQARNDRRLHEVHPEISFRAMNEGRSLGYRKKSAGGALERISLLERHGIDVSTLGESASAPLDDVLDAAAAAWTALRIARYEAHPLPDPPEEIDGLQVAIWY